MTYTYDNGHPPCYDHDGRAEPVLDQTLPEITGTYPIDEAIHHGHAVIGWKAACACDWKSHITHLRADHPTSDKNAHLAPDHLADIFGPIEREWHAHVRQAIPEARLRDLHNQSAAPEVMGAEVQMLRVRSVSWKEIAEATDTSQGVARARWGHLDLWVREASGQDTRPGPEAFLGPLAQLEALAGPNGVQIDQDPAVQAVEFAAEGLAGLLTASDPDAMDQAISRMEWALEAAYKVRVDSTGSEQVSARAWGDHINGHGNLETNIDYVTVKAQSAYAALPDVARIEWDGPTENDMSLRIRPDYRGPVHFAVATLQERHRRAGNPTQSAGRSMVMWTGHLDRAPCMALA